MKSLVNQRTHISLPPIKNVSGICAIDFDVSAKAGFPFQDIYLNSLYIITVYACTANVIRLIHFAYS